MTSVTDSATEEATASHAPTTVSSHQPQRPPHALTQHDRPRTRQGLHDDLLDHDQHAKIVRKDRKIKQKDKVDEMAVLSSAPLQFIASIPTVTRAFTAATILTSLVYYWLWWTSDETFSVPYLVLVPGSSLFYPWTLITSAFVETSIFEVRPHRLQ